MFINHICSCKIRTLGVFSISMFVTPLFLFTTKFVSQSAVSQTEKLLYSEYPLALPTHNNAAKKIQFDSI